MVEAIKKKLSRWYIQQLRHSPLMRRVSLTILDWLIRIVGKKRAAKWTLFQIRSSFSSKGRKSR